jgi:predicted nuclease of predicted toxin-antitoxin system
MARLLADENFPRPVADALRALGHDFTTAQAEGLGGVPDPDVLAAASAAGRAVLTHDRDFIRLHRTSSAHGGIVPCSVDTDTAALAGRIDAALTGAALPGQLVRVYRPATP